eukprot:TRINITY_DN48900_c0_g1_i1.p1 TRINITY_DN48900_c0_g1~~TRINITY_DN48900_c0_g1_i1.p1  ORF type:complete len:943 (-),score=170.85 TRINITY_DN48900_c0_g1_i1:110-2938(-)
MDELQENEPPPLVEFALRTFAIGLFPTTTSVDQPTTSVESNASCTVASDNVVDERLGAWQCVAQACEIAGAPGFTTLSCGDKWCVGITPEGDVHRWEVGQRGTSALSHCFSLELSLSVLQDTAGQRLQLRDVAIGHHCTPRSSRDQPNHTATLHEGHAVGAVALMDGGEVFTAPVPGRGWQPVPCLQSYLVVSVACGSCFCTVLTASGELLAWGASSCGALGLVAEDGTAVCSAPQPQPVRGALLGLRVAAVACGDGHVVAATFDEDSRAGAVFSWGSGANERLGYGTVSGVQLEPRSVDWLVPSLGDVLLARREGSAWASPENKRFDGRSPVDDAADQPKRRHASIRSPQRITQVACGVRHTVILCQGGLICFGADDFGQLGRRPGEDRETEGLAACASAPALLSFASCGDSAAVVGDALGDDWGGDELVASRVCCGPLHTAAVSSDGSLHVWGLHLLRPPPSDVEQISGNASPGVMRVRSFGPSRPVVALACGAHFVVASAEVEVEVHLASGRPSDAAARLEGGQLYGIRSAWRPANLPPKQRDEALKHKALVRDLEKCVQRRLERENREARIRLDREERREKRIKAHTEEWLTQLVPLYVHGERPSRRMEKLWRQGLPPKVREMLWPVAIGNVLRITPELFEIHAHKAVEAMRIDGEKRSNGHSVPGESSKSQGREQSTACITLDLVRTFPTLAFFNVGGPLHEDCSKILQAYTFFRPDIGYVQGMSYLAAMLLLYMPVYPAFVSLCNLINSPSILGLYRLEPAAVACRSDLFHKLCSAQLPAVAQNIDEAGLTAEMFLIEWFMTLFSKCLPIDVASVVWDLFLLDGEVVLYCTGIALFRILERSILDGGANIESLSKILSEEMRRRVTDADELLWHLQEVWRRSPPELLADIRNIEHLEFSSTSAGKGGGRRIDESWQRGSILADLRSSIFSRFRTPR